MSFASDLQKFAKKTGAAMDHVVRASVLTMGENIIKASPVDTGRFRANWQHNTGTPASGPVESLDLSGAATLAKLNASVAPVKAGNIEYLTNNLPYAIPLEYGYSDQAPGGMVRIEVARFQAAVRDAVRDIK